MPAPSLGSFAEGMTSEQLAQQNVTLNTQAIQGNAVKLKDMQVGLMRDKLLLMQQMRFMQLMSHAHFGSAGGSTPDSMAGFLNEMAVVEAESGAPDKAAAIASKAAEISSRGADVQYKQYQMQSKRLQTFADILSGVPDNAAGYKQALQAMVQVYPNAVKDPMFQRLAKTPWAPGLIGSIKNSVLTAKDRALIQYRKFEAQHATNMEKLEAQRVELDKQRNKLAAQRDKAIGKDGGKPVTAGQLQAITDQASREFPGSDPADLRVRSRPVAEEMLQLMRTQHLTLSEAAVKAYQQAKKDGVYAGLRKMPGIKGTSADNPLPKPEDPSKLMQQQWYEIDGQPQLLLGDKFYTQQQLDELDKENQVLNGQ